MQRLCTFFALLLLLSGSAAAQTDPLPSWNEGPAKKAILEFVDRVTNEKGVDSYPPAERIATFDNDGTLWCEQPLYVQFAFALERVKTLAPEHPEWKDKEPFKSVLAGDVKSALGGGEHAIAELIMATHAGMTNEQFEKIVLDWLATAKHPRFKCAYTDLAYQPMIELLSYLRSNQFKTYIVSGGGIEFMRPWTKRVYGIPPEQVVGSTIKTKYEMPEGRPVIMRLPDIDFVDDGPGKPVGINKFIGRRPIAAFGNSDGDREMLEWTTVGGGGLRLGMIVHHTDAEREYAYDRDSHIGHLAKALDEAPQRGWVVIDMKKDWNRIFKFDAASPPPAK